MNQNRLTGVTCAAAAAVADSAGHDDYSTSLTIGNFFLIFRQVTHMTGPL
jgi:hypothetical protein